MRPYPAVMMVPRCKDRYYGKDLLFMAQAVHSFLVHWPVPCFSIEHSIQILCNQGTLSLWFQQASRTVNLMEGYLCVHSRTIFTLYNDTLQIKWMTIQVCVALTNFSDSQYSMVIWH